MKIVTTETHKSPTGQPMFRVTLSRGKRVLQGFACLTATEAAEIAKALAAREEGK